ncbi:alpha/beta hydrolase family protein [Chloroflexota bacterium]
MKQQKEKVRRMAEQRWLIDKVIASTGSDLTWPMSSVALGATGLDLAPDVMRLRERIKKWTDIPREYARVAAKREIMAKQAEDEGHLVTARDNYFAASVFYGMAQWTFHEDDDEENIAYNARKNECYDGFINHAPHPVERVEIPFEGKSLPGILHFPPNSLPKMPCVLSMSGVDGFKEYLTPLYGSKFLERGIAVLAIDGPGQGESGMRQIRCTTDNFARVGKAAMDYMAPRPEIDASRIGVSGISLGSFWVTQIAAYDNRYKAAAALLVCHEPGMKTVFRTASPTIKSRFMWMAGYEDEDEFDRFTEKLTLKGLGAKIKCPFLIVGGEDDEVSPIEHSYNLYHEIKAPKKIVVYKGERHGISCAMDMQALVADWMKDRLDGKPMQSESILMDAATGRPC